jgi:hypothetical protein
MAKIGLPNVARVQFFAKKHSSLWLEVNGKKYAISQYSSTFAVNEIPSATCVLATGEKINKKEKDKFNPAEDLAASLSGVGFAKAEVILKFSGTKTDWEPPLGSKGWRGTKKIFEGYYAGISYHRVGNKIQCTVSLVHKLVDLTFGSIFSAKMHSSNPASLIRPATVAVLGGCGGFAAGGSWASTAFVGDKLPPPAAKGANQGLGGRLIKILKCLAELDIFELPCDGDGPSGVLNGAVMEILENMESETGELKPPLNQPPFDTSIASYIGNNLNSFRGTTFWDLLVGKWCPDFMIALSPLPGKTDGGKFKCYANLIPNIPTYDKFFKTLYLNDYVEFQMRATQENPLAAVGILSPVVSATGAQWVTEPKSPQRGYTCIGGQYPKTPKPQGQYLALDAPGWFQQVLESSKGASEIAKGANEISNPNQKQNNRPTSYEAYKAPLTEAMNNIAHVYYAANALRGRVGSFSSKLRFDIPPGAMVTLKKSPKAAGGATKDLPSDFHVQITRVSYNINSDTPVARTEFQCATIRTPRELKDKDYTLSSHPFVDGTWNGDEFVKGWGF